MKEISTGSNTGLDIGGGSWIGVPLNGTGSNFTNTESRPRKMMLSFRFTTQPEIGSIISVRHRLGSSVGGQRPITNLDDSFVIESFATHFQRYQMKVPVNMGPSGSEFDVFSVQVQSNDAADDSEGIAGVLNDMDDVQSIGGEDVTTTSGKLDVNAALAGGNDVPAISDIENAVKKFSHR